MKKTVKKRGQKFIKRFSRTSEKISQEGQAHIKENLIDKLSNVENVRLLMLEWGLLVVALIMLAITQAFWFADSYAENSFVAGGNYTEATLGEVDSLNPLFATTSSEKTLSRLMFATLSSVDYSGHIGIGLAKTITPTENGKVWVVALRDGLKWSDGEPITNEDVVFTAELIKNPAVNSVYSSNLSKVNVSINENQEIVFTLPSAYADFMTALNFPILPKHILGDADPKKIVEHSFSNAPVTSGAFTFNATQSEVNSTEKIFYLSANPNYYKGKLLLDSFEIHTYETKDEIIAALNNGVVTGTAELSGAESSKVNKNKFGVKNSSLNSGVFMFFNTSHDNVSNVELRKAIREGINMEDIRAEAPDNLALDYPLLPSQITLTNYPEIPDYNLENAKAKVQELSDGGQIHLDVATLNSGYLPKVAEKVKSELENLGFAVDLTVYEENQDFINNVISKRGYDILIYAIELGATPDLIPYYHSSQATSSGLNLSNYRNTMVDDSLLGARSILDESLTVKKYETFLNYWANDVPAIGLYQPNLTYYYNKNTHVFGDNITLSTTLDRFVDITSWSVAKTTKNKTP